MSFSLQLFTEDDEHITTVQSPILPTLARGGTIKIFAEDPDFPREYFVDDVFEMVFVPDRSGSVPVLVCVKVVVHESVKSRKYFSELGIPG